MPTSSRSHTTVLWLSSHRPFAASIIKCTRKPKCAALDRIIAVHLNCTLYNLIRRSFGIGCCADALVADFVMPIKVAASSYV